MYRVCTGYREGTGKVPAVCIFAENAHTAPPKKLASSSARPAAALRDLLGGGGTGPGARGSTTWASASCSARTGRSALDPCFAEFSIFANFGVFVPRLLCPPIAVND